MNINLQSNEVFSENQINILKDNLIKIFGEKDIETAFITGSIAAGTHRPDSDIDILICISDEKEFDIKKRNFENYYFNLHEEFQRTPDFISPGEVLLSSKLQESLSKLEKVIPSKILINRDEFDAICWAGMLISKKIEIIPDTTLMLNLNKIAYDITHKWASLLEPEIILTVNTGNRTDIDKVLRRNISCPGYYDAH